MGSVHDDNLWYGQLARERKERLADAGEAMLDALLTAKACLERLDQTKKSKTAYSSICVAIAKAEGTLIAEERTK